MGSGRQSVPLHSPLLRPTFRVGSWVSLPELRHFTLMDGFVKCKVEGSLPPGVLGTREISFPATTVLWPPESVVSMLQSHALKIALKNVKMVEHWMRVGVFVSVLKDTLVPCVKTVT